MSGKGKKFAVVFVDTVQKFSVIMWTPLGETLLHADINIW